MAKSPTMMQLLSALDRGMFGGDTVENNKSIAQKEQPNEHTGLFRLDVFLGSSATKEDSGLKSNGLNIDANKLNDLDRKPDQKISHCP